MASNIHCRHWSNPFVRGRREDACAHGINIRELVGGPDFGWSTRRPCVHGSLHRPSEAVTCEKREPYTKKEIADAEAAHKRAFQLFIEGKSPCCEAELIKRGNVKFCAKCKEFVARECGAEDMEP